MSVKGTAPGIKDPLMRGKCRVREASTHQCIKDDINISQWYIMLFLFIVEKTESDFYGSYIVSYDNKTYCLIYLEDRWNEKAKENSVQLIFNREIRCQKISRPDDAIVFPLSNSITYAMKPYCEYQKHSEVFPHFYNLINSFQMYYLNQTIT